MAIDSKYGAVQVEFGKIGNDEPVFVLRAQDAMSGTMLSVYKALCERAGSPPEHLDSIDQANQALTRWQNSHIEQVKVPD